MIPAGAKWCNNGVKNSRKLELPEGWVWGRIGHTPPTNKGKKWCNNGSEQLMKTELPENWSWGRLKGPEPWNKGKTFKKKNNTQVPWNKGKKGLQSHSEEHKENIRQRMMGNTHGFVEGQEPWNKGIPTPNPTKGIKRPHGNYVSGPAHPFWREDKGEFHDYKVRVRYLTEKTYEENVEKINPNFYNRVIAGNEGYQLDHIVSISEAYELGWAPEQCASLNNLQMLPWRENLKKGGINRK